MSLDCRDCYYYGKESGPEYQCDEDGNWYDYDDVIKNFEACPNFKRR